MFSQHGATNYVCFDCRRAASLKHWTTDSVTCPSCRAPMTLMGAHFKVPRRIDVKQWEKVRRLREQSCYFVCRCKSPRYRWHSRGKTPIRTLSDAKNALHQRRSDQKPPLKAEKVPKWRKFG